MKSLRIHIINLEYSSDRRESMRTRLDALGLNYEFFPAVSGRNGEHHRFANYSDDSCLKAWRRPLAAGEVGCFASHYQLWQKCVERNEPIIVMEDDVAVSRRFGEAVELAAGVLQEMGHVRLSGLYLRRFRLVRDLPNGWRLVRFFQAPVGAQCYAISPQGASRLLEHASTWHIPVDNYMDAFWQHGVPCIGILPFVAWQKHTGSDIHDIGGYRNPVRKPKRIAVRLADVMQRIMWNLLVPR